MRGNEDAKRYRIEIAKDMSRREIAQAQKSPRAAGLDRPIELITLKIPVKRSRYFSILV